MKIYIITGEKSGDKHASKIVHELKNLDNNLKFKAWGGNHLESEGVILDKHINEISYMGFWEVFINIFKVINNFNQCKKDILRFSPDLILLVDYPGFNLKIAEFAFKNNFKVNYYISPKVWAWKFSRVNKIKKYVNRMFVIFPFEKDLYREQGVEVEYFGNPIYEDIEDSSNNFDLIDHKPIISLFPGSRKQEINLILPLMLKIIKFYPNYNFIISATDSFSSDYYNKLTEGYDVTHVFNRSYDLLSVSQASLVTSGTATLETALMNIPQVVCYKTSFLSYIIAKSLVNIPYVSLINILLNRKVVDELIQSKLTVKNIKESLDKVLDRDQLKPLFSDYDNLRNLLASKNVSGKIAANILETIYL